MVAVTDVVVDADTFVIGDIDSSCLKLLLHFLEERTVECVYCVVVYFACNYSH